MLPRYLGFEQTGEPKGEVSGESSVVAAQCCALVFPRNSNQLEYWYDESGNKTLVNPCGWLRGKRGWTFGLKMCPCTHAQWHVLIYFRAVQSMKVFIILKYLMLFQNENKCWSIGNSCGTEIVFFTSSNNHHCNSMSSQSNRNWASTTPGKFLSSLLYLRSKPLVFLQALLKVQLLQNVWGGMRIVCLGLGVREQVPDSPKPHKQHLANGHLKLSTLSASPGSVT